MIETISIPFTLLIVHLSVNFTQLVIPMLNSPNESIMAFHYEQNLSDIFIEEQVPIQIISTGEKEVSYYLPKGNIITIHSHKTFCEPSLNDLQIMRENNRNVDGIVCNGTVIFFDRNGAYPEVMES